MKIKICNNKRKFKNYKNSMQKLWMIKSICISLKFKDKSKFSIKKKKALVKKSRFYRVNFNKQKCNYKKKRNNWRNIRKKTRIYKSKLRILNTNTSRWNCIKSYKES